MWALHTRPCSRSPHLKPPSGTHSQTSKQWNMLMVISPQILESYWLNRGIRIPNVTHSSIFDIQTCTLPVLVRSMAAVRGERSYNVLEVLGCQRFDLLLLLFFFNKGFNCCSNQGTSAQHVHALFMCMCCQWRPSPGRGLSSVVSSTDKWLQFNLCCNGDRLSFREGSDGWNQEKERTLNGRHHLYGTSDRVVFKDHLNSSASPPRCELVPASRCWHEARALVQPRTASLPPFLFMHVFHHSVISGIYFPACGAVIIVCVASSPVRFSLA